MALKNIAIIGAGPSGLIAAEILAEAGHRVCIYDRMPSPARKLLIAGRGGLNLTHSEPLDLFLTRYGEASEWLAPAIRLFPPTALRDWCEGLGEETFVGSSGRIFPTKMKASSLLRAWLKRLESLGVQYLPRHHWLGWKQETLHFERPEGELLIKADATLLALGGASWPRLGSDGGWVNILKEQMISVTPLQPANCGFLVNWSDYLRSRFAGMPLKPLAITHEGMTRQGEAMITAQGIEGGVFYALGASLRKAMMRDGFATVTLDLRPAMEVEQLRQKLVGRGSRSLSSALKSANFSALAVALLYETGSAADKNIAACLKALPLTLSGTAPLNRAISTAGGVCRDALTANYMLRTKPGVFMAGEMMDWEAPTGGYLLQACFSTGVAAAQGILDFVSG